MQSTILTPTQEEIFVSFRAKFHDVTYFDRLLTEPVRKSIVEIDTHVITLTATTAKSFANKYICARKLPSKEDKALSVPINHIMCTLFVFMIIPAEADTNEMKAQKIEVLMSIINWDDCDNSERSLLITFRDVIRIAVTLFPGKDNKARILFIGHRLGGSDLSVMSYATGGGQSSPTDRRVRIYEIESGVSATPKSTEEDIPVVTVQASKKRTRDVMEVSPPPSNSPDDLLKQYNDIKQMVEKYQATCAFHIRQRTAHYQAPRDPPTTHMVPEPAQPVRDLSLMLPPSGFSRFVSALGVNSAFSFSMFAQQSDLNISALTCDGDEVPTTTSTVRDVIFEKWEVEHTAGPESLEENTSNVLSFVDIDAMSMGALSFLNDDILAQAN